MRPLPPCIRVDHSYSKVGQGRSSHIHLFTHGSVSFNRHLPGYCQLLTKSFQSGMRKRPSYMYALYQRIRISYLASLVLNFFSFWSNVFLGPLITALVKCDAVSACCLGIMYSNLQNFQVPFTRTIQMPSIVVK